MNESNATTEDSFLAEVRAAQEELEDLLVSGERDFPGVFRGNLSSFEMEIAALFKGRSALSRRYKIRFYESLIESIGLSHPYVSLPLIQGMSHRVYILSFVDALASRIDRGYLTRLFKRGILLLTIPSLWVCLTLGWILLGALGFELTQSLHHNCSDTLVSPSESLYYALMCFTSLGASEIEPSSLGKLIVSVEAVVGYFMLGILVSIIVRRIIR